MAKKELISELDLSGIERGQRNQTIDRLIGLTTVYLEARFLAAEGYKHSRMEFKPFENSPHIIGVHVTCQRGLIWGYTVTFEPLDAKNHNVKTTLTTNTNLFDIVGTIAFLPVIALGIWVFTQSTFDFSRDTRTIFIAIFALLFLALALFGVLWVLVRPIMSMFIDQQEQANEMADLREKIRDTIIEPANYA